MKTTNFEKVVAIDGPSGSGKSTIAKELARALGVLYIDTGAMFRALGHIADFHNIPFKECDELTQFLKNIDLQYGVSDKILIQINGEDLTEKIRDHHVSFLASSISQLPSVRSFLLAFQRGLALDRVCVMEGRDIGTVVFPHSFSKFFITASVEVRAQRRLLQLQGQGDQMVTLEKVIEDVKNRDESDMNRLVAPLKKAEDAMVFDTTNMALMDIVNLLTNEIKFRLASLGLLTE